MITKNRRPMAEINVVPYIDVMLVLLVIFMITAPLLSQGVHVDLPSANAKPLAQDREPVIVSIDEQGQYFLNTALFPERALSEQELMEQVRHTLEAATAQHQTREVFVKGDKKVSYDRVMQAMVILQKAGASSVGLITQSSSSEDSLASAQPQPVLAP